MRRQWATLLLFALALVVQTLAPAAGAVSVAGASSGFSVASTVICLTDGRSVGDQKQAPGKAGHHRDLCPLCQSTCDGVPPLAVRIAFIWSEPLVSGRLVWSIGARAPPTPDFEHARQARAPPAIS